MLQQGTNLVNKFALLLHKYWFTQDPRNKSANDGCRGRGVKQIAREQRSVAYGNKVMDTRLPQPAGCGDKYDVSGWCWGRTLNTFCMFFKYPSPEAYASPSPSRGEGLHRPWGHKILGTDCASRPRMTGDRGVGLVRLLRRYTPRNDAERTNIAFKGLDVVRQYATLLERRVQRGTQARKALVVTRQANPLGRSMIEMLGVLAIIAVLSVGGIAGYSKAMTMFKINKWKENFTMMMTNLKVTYSNSRSYNTDAPGKNMVSFFKEINVIPTNMLDDENKDLFGNIVSIYSPEFSPEWNRLTILFFMPPNKESVEVCKAFFSLTPDFRNMWTANLNDNLKIGKYELCGYGVPAEIAKQWNCQYYRDGILPQIAQSCAICSQYSCDLKLIISNNS